MLDLRERKVCAPFGSGNGPQNLCLVVFWPSNGIFRTRGPAHSLLVLNKDDFSKPWGTGLEDCVCRLGFERVCVCHRQVPGQQPDALMRTVSTRHIPKQRWVSSVLGMPWQRQHYQRLGQYRDCTMCLRAGLPASVARRLPSLSRRHFPSTSSGG